MRGKELAAETMQNGGKNRGFVSQQLSGNADSSSCQLGNSNEAGVTQSGEDTDGVSSDIDQPGNSNDPFVDQLGIGAESLILHTATGNFAALTPAGATSSAVDQAGDGKDTPFRQHGPHNTPDTTPHANGPRPKPT